MNNPGELHDIIDYVRAGSREYVVVSLLLPERNGPDKYDRKREERGRRVSVITAHDNSIRSSFKLYTLLLAAVFTQ